MTNWRIGQTVAFVDSGRRVVALNLADANARVPLAIEGTGAEIWRAIARGEASGVTPQEVLGSLSRDFETEPEAIAESVMGFVDQLLALGLVAVEPLVAD